MPAYKQTATVATVTTPVFRLAGDTLARRLAFGSDWTRLRFGFRVQLATVPVAGIATPVRLDFGLDCAAGPLYANTFDAPNMGSHWLVQRQAWQLENRVAGPPVVFRASAGANSDRMVDGHDLTDDFTVTTGEARLSGDPDVMGCFLVEVLKGNPDWQWSFLFPGVDAMVNRTSAQLSTAMSVADMPTAQVTLGATYALVVRTVTGADARAVAYGQPDRVFASFGAGSNTFVNLTDFTVRRLA